MLEVNKPYTSKELAEALSISYGTFRNNKNNILYNISLISEFSCEVGSRGQVTQTFTEVWDEQKKVSKGTKQLEYARKRVRAILKQSPYQTAQNLGEMLAEEMGVCEKTAARQCGQVLKEYYGTDEGDWGEDGCVGDKVYCYRIDNEWKPMKIEQVDEMFSEWGKYNGVYGLGVNAKKKGKTEEEIADGRMKILSAVRQSMCEKMGWRWIARVNGQFPHDS